MKFPTPLILLALLLTSVSRARAQGPVFHEDFESGASSWTFGGAWHLEADTSVCGAALAPYPSPGHCAWFGSAHPSSTGTLCDYSVAGYQGGILALTAPIPLPVQADHLVVRYRRFLETEYCIGGYDFTHVDVLDGSGAVLHSASTDCGLEGGWVDRRVDLHTLAGASIRLRFVFNPGDGQFDLTTGWWIDDVEVVNEPGVITCTAAAVCPCGAAQQLFHPTVLGAGPNEDSGGCKHSNGVEARLFGNGVPSVSNDTVELVVHDCPSNTVALFVQGTGVQSGVFGDGRLCVSGPFVRLALHGVQAGQDDYPHAGEAGVAARGSIPAGGATRTYQVVYRDAAAYCTSSTFNTSNGYAIAWRP